MKNRGLIFIFIFGFFVLFVLINDFIQIRKGEKEQVNFIISKIDVSPTKSLILFDGDKEVELWNYIIPDYEYVKVGDLVNKNKNSQELFILRRDKITGKFMKNIILKPIR